MIGLRRGTVRLAPYTFQWVKEFENERRKLKKSLGGSVLAIEHVGSTSVPGLRAKPVIDISIGIRRLKDASKLARTLKVLGYRFHRKMRAEMFFAKGPDAKRTHYVHIVRYQGNRWKMDLLFRDYLRSHPPRVQAYARLKQKLARQFPHVRERYTSAKGAFIKATLERVLQSH